MRFGRSRGRSTNRGPRRQTGRMPCRRCSSSRLQADLVPADPRQCLGARSSASGLSRPVHLRGSLWRLSVADARRHPVARLARRRTPSSRARSCLDRSSSVTTCQRECLHSLTLPTSGQRGSVAGAHLDPDEARAAVSGRARCCRVSSSSRRRSWRRRHARRPLGCRRRPHVVVVPMGTKPAFSALMIQTQLCGVKWPKMFW